MTEIPTKNHNQSMQDAKNFELTKLIGNQKR
jgi:hypothetical protein